jgi:hypothetical protein
MDQRRFDDLARSLAAGRTRRHVMRAAAGGIAAGFLAIGTRRGVEAQTCGVLGDDCAEVADCCNGLTCFEAKCDNPSGLCMDSGEFCGSSGLECCSGLVCTNDYCAASSLPSTGTGSVADDDSASLLGLGAVAGAGALLAAKLLRDQSTPSTSED